RWPAWLAFLFIAPPSLTSLMIYILPDWWISDLFVHFRIHYLVIGVTGAIWMLGARRYWMAALAASAIAINLAPVSDYFDNPGISPATAMHSRSDPDDFTRLRIASANIFAGNDRYDLVADWITANQPDIAVLIEATTPWRDQMRNRLPQYPYQEIVIRPGYSGKIIVSRFPIAILEKLPPIGHRSATPLITVDVQQARFRLAALHTSWPLKKTWAADRNKELIDLAVVARTKTTPFIAVGDFNITPFSKHFSQMLEKGGLHRAAAGRGWLPTWPSFFVPAGIQIDHVLISSDVQVVDYQVGDGLRSDHRWVMADLLVPKQPRPKSQ
ncbi:MAG: endonuclease/exonuclease/phosphatase family protein, partial [Burkholderiaceae bacterium]